MRNLDASVILLTPLYIQVARQTGRHPFALAFQPVLLACLASSALPVSNLTNLIAASDAGANTIDFVTKLAVPSLVATTTDGGSTAAFSRPTRSSRYLPEPVTSAAIRMRCASAASCLPASSSASSPDQPSASDHGWLRSPPTS